MNNSLTCEQRLIQLYTQQNRSCSRRVAADAELCAWVHAQAGIQSDCLPEMIYAIMHPDQSQICGSGNVRKFRNINQGWMRCHDPACQDCRQRSQARSRATCQARYGVDSVMQVPEIRDSMVATARERGSYTQAQQRRREYYQKHHRVDHNWKTTQGQLKRKQTIKQRYGVDNVSQSAELQQKKVETSRKNHGTDYPMQSQAVQQRQRDTVQQRYGVNNVSELPEVRDRARKTMMERYGVAYSGQSEILNQRARQARLYRFGVQHDYSALNSLENSCAEFVESLGVNVVRYTQAVIPPWILDLYLPDHNLALEFNRVHTHSEITGGKNKFYHRNKSDLCAVQGIHLIQILDYEWMRSQDLVKSRIRQQLGLNTPLAARKCTITDITSAQAREFLAANHIQGACNASVNHGLWYQDQLVSVMSWSRSRYSKLAQYELLRFCSAQGLSVQGAASRLLRRFEQQHGHVSMVSYCDLRWNTGQLYKTLGFVYAGRSDPSYWYFRDPKNPESRIKYQKHRLPALLENYRADQSEWQNMQNHGYDRIWDCGHSVFVKNV